MFEVVEYVEDRLRPEPEQKIVGLYDDEVSAVEGARQAKAQFLDTGSDDFAWWVVRQPGARLAQFISDSRSQKEFVLDLTTGQLVEVD